MSEEVTIAVDAMGGDDAPGVVLDGVAQALEADGALHVVLCGPAEVVEPFAAAHERCEARVTTEVIGMGEHPAEAVRKKKDSSVVVGCRLVREGAAQGFFSAGSTGACLAAGDARHGPHQGRGAPGAGHGHPVARAPGGHVRRRRERGLQACVPRAVRPDGHRLRGAVVGIENPRAALLNIGEEETKGSQFAQEAHALLREQLPNFAGNAEGGDILPAKFDVIVTDGFTGNVCLKTIEGTSKTLFKTLKGIMMRTPRHEAGGARHQGRPEGAHGAGEPRHVRRRAASGREGGAAGGARLLERLRGEERRAHHGRRGARGGF